MIGIYKITNPENEIYIGQSINIEKRFLSHSKNSNNKKLIESIKKYGWINHKLEVLCECNKSELNKKESEFIKDHSVNFVMFNNILGRPKRPDMVQITRKVHINALPVIDKYIKKLNKQELKRN